MSRKISLGTFENSKKFEESLLDQVELPEIINIVSVNTGIVNEGKENEIVWANGMAADNSLLEKFRSIDEERLCPLIKIKFKQYSGQSINNLIGQNIIIHKNDCEVSLIYNKFQQAIGLALVMELDNIELA